MATEGKVLSLYMTMPDMMRPGHRTVCDNFECDPQGIIGDMNYDNDAEHVLLLLSQKSYELIEAADLVVDHGVLLENIFVDIDLNHLKKGAVIEIGEHLFEVTGPCEAYRYLYALSPELPDILHGNRGIFVTPMEHCEIRIGDTVNVLKQA
jgi:MOSC domain-containing protein YiiM